MRKQTLFTGLATAALLGVGTPCWADCQLGQLAQLPVTIENERAIVPALMNGEEITMVIDSGAFYSVLSEAASKHAGLHERNPPRGFYLRGVNGNTQVSLATVKEFKLANLNMPETEFIVGGTDIGAGASGVMGQNLLGWKDVEYDLGNGVVRLFKPHDCGTHSLAYWVKTEQLSMIDIQSLTAARFHTIGDAYLNGKKIRVMFDTGAPTSVLTRHAAEQAGFKVDGPDVRPLGSGAGWGQGWYRQWSARFDSFKLGGEEIRNARLRVGDLTIIDSDMLLGLDFFLSHRVYVSNEQHRLYFTYNGGPVFDLSAAKSQTAAVPAPPENQAGPATDSEPAAPDNQAAPGSAGTNPTDAAEYSRRGMALAARRDFAPALEDLNRACELAPTESSYFSQRGLIQWQSGNADAGLKDFDQALQLNPDNLDALLGRMRMRRHSGDVSGATADLDSAANTANKEADIRLDIGELYSQMWLYPQAIVQYDMWVAVHPVDARLPMALIGRCWARAMLNDQLDEALSDCNQALSLNSKYVNALDSRGLVQLRRGQFQKAIADYDKVLAINPKSAWALYGRGIAKIRLGQNAEGQQDIGAATVQNPKLPANAAKFGISP